MRKTNLELLQEALAAGDLERAQTLTAKLVKSGKIKTTKTRVKVETAEKTPRKSRPRKDLDVRDVEESSYIASSRPPGWSEDNFGGRKFVGPDGKEHTYARRVSLEGIKFVNKFKPEGYKDLSVKEKKLEKQIKGFRTVPRPGQRGAQRDKAKKVEARCVICHNVVKVYPWEIETVDGESNFRCSKKSCVRAR